ncbi:hypothetical protein HYH03_001814 [Edaphochlamys debaryana]|uniref:Uncharacterized protein n=1 Tax=Edaphochlamys debaryana TaxID=47281 RepID=A0A835YCS4_9CHLO|nr:hypothetical protein HYH03_001814 [Edaphochlamys debaryana]|eukprot:KAG2500236.1 hypothetical protein HYH03_001814 [Edaphochlamys debaryana]
MLRIVAENVHRVHIAAGVEHQVRVDGTHHLLTALASIPGAAEYVERGTICVDPVALLRKFRLLKKPLFSWMRPQLATQDPTHFLHLYSNFGAEATSMKYWPDHKRAGEAELTQPASVGVRPGTDLFTTVGFHTRYHQAFANKVRGEAVRLVLKAALNQPLTEELAQRIAARTRSLLSALYDTNSLPPPPLAAGLVAPVFNKKVLGHDTRFGQPGGADPSEAGRKAQELGYGFGGVNGASPLEAGRKAVELGYGFGGVNGADAVEAGRLGGEKAVELGYGFGGVNGASPSEAGRKAVELGYGFGGVNGADAVEAGRLGGEKAVELGYGFGGVNGASPLEAGRKAVELGYGFGGVNGADAVEAGRLGGEKAVELGYGFGGVNGASPSEAGRKAVELGYGFGGVNGADAVEAGRLGGEKAVELGYGFGGVNGASPSEAAEKAVELGYGFGGVNGDSPSEACRRSNKAQGKASEGESAGVCALSGLTGKKGKLLCPNSGQHGPWLRWGNGGLALCSTCYKRIYFREARGRPE